MPKQTRYVKSLNRAHGQLLRGFNKTLDSFSRVPLGHNILDPRTLENRVNTNIAGMTAGLPMDSRKVFQAPKNRPAELLKGGQTDRNRAAGIVVDPTAIETAQGADSVSIDTTGGYGITNSPMTGDGGD